jgi:hypothetical protein
MNETLHSLGFDPAMRHSLNGKPEQVFQLANTAGDVWQSTLV